MVRYGWRLTVNLNVTIVNELNRDGGIPLSTSQLLGRFILEKVGSLEQQQRETVTRGSTKAQTKVKGTEPFS